MLDASLYISGGGQALPALALMLDVMPKNAVAHAQPGVDFGFYQRQENSIRCSSVKGDFSFACDVGLFRITAFQLHEKLRQLGEQGWVIALPDETSESPLQYWLFENGSAKTAVILRNDASDKVTIWRGEQRE